MQDENGMMTSPQCQSGAKAAENLLHNIGITGGLLHYSGGG